MDVLWTPYGKAYGHPIEILEISYGHPLGTVMVLSRGAAVYQ